MSEQEDWDRYIPFSRPRYQWDHQWYADRLGANPSIVGRAVGLIGRTAGQILGDGLRVEGCIDAMLLLADGLRDEDMLRMKHSGDKLVSLVRAMQALAARERGQATEEVARP